MGSRPLRLACLLIAGLMAMPALARSAPAPRLALVIGNSAYTEFSRLVNPVNDAHLMARTLRGLGFEVVLRTNANRDAMITAVRKFVDQIKSAGREAVVLFYFAGHGVESKGSNYLIPLGVEIRRFKGSRRPGGCSAAYSRRVAAAEPRLDGDDSGCVSQQLVPAGQE